MRISDWSSDVCSSDLLRPRRRIELDAKRAYVVAEHFAKLIRGDPADEPGPASQRGYACRSIRRRTARRFPARRHASIEPCRLLCVDRSEEHTSELQSLMRISYAVFCLKQKKTKREKSNLLQQKQ